MLKWTLARCEGLLKDIPAAFSAGDLGGLLAPPSPVVLSGVLSTGRTGALGGVLGGSWFCFSFLLLLVFSGLFKGTLATLGSTAAAASPF